MPCDRSREQVLKMLRTCPTCSHRPPMDYERCPKCGSDLAPPPFQTNPVVASWVWAIGALVLAVSIIVLALFHQGSAPSHGSGRSAPSL